MGKQSLYSDRIKTSRNRALVVVSLVLCPLLLLQSSSSGALIQTDSPPWDDLEEALLQLTAAEAELQLSEMNIDEKEQELTGLLRAENKEEALEISFLLEMKEAEDLTRKLAIEAFMGGDSVSSAAYLLDSKNVGDLIFRRAILKETTEAVEKQSQAYEEMKDALDLRSKSGIHRLINALEERGFIRRLAHRARAIEIIKLPTSSTINPKGNFQPEVIEGNKEKDLFSLNEESIEVRMMGKIAAGTPIAAIEYEKNKISVPGSMVGTGDHYALEIEGDSMIGAGILDKDKAIIKKVDDALSGQIVVALVDGEEATLKRLRKKGNTIALEPANSAYETKIYGPERIQIQGILVGILRSY